MGLSRFALPLLLLWAIILPGLFFGLIFSIRKKLDEPENRFRLGFFYNEYEMHAFYWEFVKIFEKGIIIIVLTYYEDSVIIKGSIIFFIIFGYSWAILIVNPFKSQTLNRLDLFSTIVCEISVSLAILMFQALYE